MITFVPTTDFQEIAQCLDDKRLGAQRYESYSILKWLREDSKLVTAGYCTMWKGYEAALVRYVNAMLVEWDRRGKNNVKLQPYMPGVLEEDDDDDPVVMPPWWGNETLHSYHRHALVAKFPEHYKKFGWQEDGSAYNGSYMWPVQMDHGEWILRWPKALKIPSVTIVPPCAAGTDYAKRTSGDKVKPSTPQKPQKTMKRSPKQSSPREIRKRKATVVTPENTEKRRATRSNYSMRLRSSKSI